MKAMALRKNGKYSYGTEQSDLREELADYSRSNAYQIEHFADAVCVCGGTTFALLLDDDEGAAIRVCARCDAQHAIGDSSRYLWDADMGECACPCGGEEFEITAGVALYAESEDVKWFYLGCRCVKCELVACYGDWKNECEDYRALLQRV